MKVLDLSGFVDPEGRSHFDAKLSFDRIGRELVSAYETLLSA